VARGSRLFPEVEAWEIARQRDPDRPGWPMAAVIKATVLLACLAMLPGGARAASLEPWTAGPMPPFELSALGGGRMTLASHRGNITLVHFFTTWCEPCRHERPALDRFAARHKPQGLRVLAIDVGEVDVDWDDPIVGQLLDHISPTRPASHSRSEP